jgi:hypothetical protein
VGRVAASNGTSTRGGYTNRTVNMGAFFNLGNLE